jgi:cytochrome c-type biogenesis protein
VVDQGIGEAVGVAGSFVSAVTDGPLLLAVPVAAAAGLVSFLSPCCLPLVPGYLSYVTGMSGDGVARAGASHGPVAVDRPRVLAGSILFVAGFSAVFIAEGALFGGIGGQFVAHRRVVEATLGAVTVLMGLAFMGWLPAFARDVRIHRLPRAGLLGAPLLGLAFGVGWTPCLGPTLAAVQSLAYTQASAARGALLTAAYCAGLGLPFVLTGLMYQRALRFFGVIRRHQLVVTRVGGGLLIAIGALLATGAWQQLTVHLRAWTAAFDTML